MKNTILILILALVTITAFAQEIKNVAIIYPFDKYDNVETTNEIYLQSQLSEKIIEAEFYKAFTRSDINAIIDEHSFQETGMVNDDEIQKIGDMTGATHICVSNFISENSNVVITVKIIEIKTGEIIAEKNESVGIGINNPYYENSDYEVSDYEIINSYCRDIAIYLNILLPPIQQIYPTMSYNNTNEAITFINERIIESISIDNKTIYISSANFKINKVTFSYLYNNGTSLYRKYKYKISFHRVEITCKNGSCIKYNSKKQIHTYLDCRTKKDAQDVVKAFQFIQSKF